MESRYIGDVMTDIYREYNCNFLPFVDPGKYGFFYGVTDVITGYGEYLGDDFNNPKYTFKYDPDDIIPPQIKEKYIYAIKEGNLVSEVEAMKDGRPVADIVYNIYEIKQKYDGSMEMRETPDNPFDIKVFYTFYTDYINGVEDFKKMLARSLWGEEHLK